MSRLLKLFSNIDRSVMLVAILYSMALFIPSAWISMYAHGSVAQAQLFLGVFNALLFLVSVAAGTRRRYFLAIAAWLSVGVAWALSLRYDFASTADRTIYYRPGQPNMAFEGEFDKGIAAMILPAVMAFAVAFALSFLFDWFLRPIAPKGKLAEATEPDSTKKKTNRFKVLALLAIPLFFVQTSINASTGADWVAVAILVLTAFAVSYRLPFWKGLLTLVAFAVAILFTSIQLMAVRMGGDTRSTVVAMLMFGILGTLIPVWLLVGNNSHSNKRNAGWLAAMACLVVGAFGWVYVQYDPGSLFFGPRPFNFEVAKSMRNVDSHPNVRVKLNSWYGRQFKCEIEFEDDEGVDDFFETNPLPDLVLMLKISSMPETVDLSPVEQYSVANLDFDKSRLSSSQLVSLAKIQAASSLYTIGFTNCRFVPEDVEWPANSNPRFGIDKFDGSGKEFLDAVKDLDALTLYVGAVDEKSYQPIVDALKERGSAMQLVIGSHPPELAGALAEIEDLSNVTFNGGVLEDGSGNLVRPYVDLIINSNATVLASPVQSDQLFWDLVMGAKGRLVISVGDIEEAREPEVPWDLHLQKIRNFHWVYDNSEASEPVTKLFVPYRRSETISALTKFPQLKSLSFDIGWSKSRYRFDSTDTEINLQPVKGVLQLKELYMPSYGKRHDLSLLAGQESLETLQFTASSLRFSQRLFPNLKHVILVVDAGSIEVELLEQLALLQHLEKLTLVVGHDYMSESFVADPKKLTKLVEGVLPKVKVGHLPPYTTYLPDDFAEHSERVREHCREKYLK